MPRTTSQSSGSPRARSSSTIAPTSWKLCCENAATGLSESGRKSWFSPMGTQTRWKRLRRGSNDVPAHEAPSVSSAFTLPADAPVAMMVRKLPGLARWAASE
jgi:hypothetical protein